MLWGARVVAYPPAWIPPFLTSRVSFFSPTLCYPSADPARVLNMPPIIYVPVGIHGFIRCPVDAEPPATVVKWNKDGRPLQVEKVLESHMRVPIRHTLPTLRYCLWGLVPCQDPSTPHQKLRESKELLPRGLWSGRALRRPFPHSSSCYA